MSNVTEKLITGLESKKLKIFIIYLVMLPICIFLLSFLKIDKDIIIKYVENVTYATIAILVGQTGIDLIKNGLLKKQDTNTNVGSM